MRARVGAEEQGRDAARVPEVQEPVLGQAEEELAMPGWEPRLVLLFVLGYACRLREQNPEAYACFDQSTIDLEGLTIEDVIAVAQVLQRRGMIEILKEGLASVWLRATEAGALRWSEIDLSESDRSRLRLDE